jgi:hypothetical protein
MKKVYIPPFTEVIGFSAEQMIAVSIGVGEGTVDAQDALTNKRKAENGIWDSKIWNSKSE